MGDCKYQSFTDLSKVNDPDNLLESFKEKAAPEHQHDITIAIYEKSNVKWTALTSTGINHDSSEQERLDNLKRFDTDNSFNDYFVYHEEHHAWYCAYYGLVHSNYAMFISTPSKDFLVDTAYLQQLFHFYCHQLHMLHGTYHDALTGLYNRRSFDKKLLQLLDLCQSPNRKATDIPSFYVMMDIDHFKNVNDTFGHLYGDEVLLQLAQLMEDSFRDNDLLFRYGGEEFAVILMNTNATDAQIVLERFRTKVENYSFPKIKKVTVSIGYTIFDSTLNIDETIAQADSALYYGKEHGRNRTSFYQQLVEKNKINAIERDDDDTSFQF